MRKFTVVGVLCLALCAVASASLQQGTPSPNLSPVFGTWVNFDDQPTGNPVNPTQYVGVGVANISDANNQLYYFPSTQSLPNYVGTGPNTGWSMDTTITLALPTNQIGIGIAGPGTVTLTAYDSSGAVVEGSTFAFGSNEYWYFTEGTYDIQSLRIQSGFIAIDDLQFNPGTSTPEPGSLMLLGSGVVGLAGFLRRRLR